MINQTVHAVYFGLGSNMGNLQNNIEIALREIAKSIGVVVKVSNLISTKAQIVTDQPDFLNGACLVHTSLGPYEVLNKIEEIMLGMGRVRSLRYGQRIIDIDILLYDNISISSEILTIPHKEMFKRDFVLIPLSEILHTPGVCNT